MLRKIILSHVLSGYPNRRDLSSTTAFYVMESGGINGGIKLHI